MKRTASGKVLVDKYGDGARSPNLADALVMAFSQRAVVLLWEKLGREGDDDGVRLTPEERPTFLAKREQFLREDAVRAAALESNVVPGSGSPKAAASALVEHDSPLLASLSEIANEVPPRVEVIQPREAVCGERPPIPAGVRGMTAEELHAVKRKLRGMW